jgi:membrane-bound lytic murein transglycosylase D
MVTPPDASFDLHLPAGTATLFAQRAALIPEARRNSWRYHPVVAGDTLASVAQEYRVSVAELASANQITASQSGQSLAGIDALVVPVPLAAEPLARTRLYTVRRGDTLVTIADRFGVSLSQLRRWNSISSGIRVDPGRRLRVAEPAPVRTSSTRRRRSSTTQNGSATAKSGNGSGKGSGKEPGAAAHQPASSAPKPAHPPASQPPNHATNSATHKSTSHAKPTRQ